MVASREGGAPAGADGPGRRRTVGSEFVREGDGLPTFIDNPVFTPVANADQAMQAIASLGQSAGEKSQKIEGLTPTPLQTSDQIGGALTRFLTPLAEGEIKDGNSFLTANGGKATASKNIPQVVQNIASVLKFCELDTTNVKVRKAPRIEGPLTEMLSKLPPGAVPMMINQQNSGDGRDVSSLMMPLSGLLEGSMEGVAPDAPRVEVTMPAKLKGAEFEDKKFLLGIILAQNGKAGKWVPQMLQFHSNQPETIKALSKVIRPRSGSVGDGSPPPKAPSSPG